MAIALRFVAGLAWLAVLTGCTGTEGPVLRNVAASSSGGADGAASGGAAGEAWVPRPDVQWQVQLDGQVDRSVDSELFVIDLANDDDIAALRADGRRVACYFSAGTHEPWRADLETVASTAVGNAVSGYPDERWLDLRDSTVVDLVQDRIVSAATSGCNAVMPANLDGYTHDSGFPLTLSDATAFASALATTAHDAGLSIVASSTDPELAIATEPSFDWVVSLGCLQVATCSAFEPYLDRGKAVLVMETADADAREALCIEAAEQGINLIFKEANLGAFRAACP